MERQKEARGSRAAAIRQCSGGSDGATPLPGEGEASQHGGEGRKAAAGVDLRSARDRGSRLAGVAGLARMSWLDTRPVTHRQSGGGGHHARDGNREQQWAVRNKTHKTTTSLLSKFPTPESLADKHPIPARTELLIAKVAQNHCCHKFMV